MEGGRDVGNVARADSRGMDGEYAPRFELLRQCVADLVRRHCRSSVVVSEQRLENAGLMRKELQSQKLAAEEHGNARTGAGHDEAEGLCVGAVEQRRSRCLCVLDASGLALRSHPDIISIILKTCAHFLLTKVEFMLSVLRSTEAISLGKTVE